MANGDFLSSLTAAAQIRNLCHEFGAIVIINLVVSATRLRKINTVFRKSDGCALMLLQLSCDVTYVECRT